MYSYSVIENGMHSIKWKHTGINFPTFKTIQHYKSAACKLNDFLYLSIEILLISFLLKLKLVSNRVTIRKSLLRRPAAEIAVNYSMFNPTTLHLVIYQFMPCHTKTLKIFFKLIYAKLETSSAEKFQKQWLNRPTGDW